MSEFTKQTYIVPDDAVGERLDKVLSRLVGGQSRSTLQQWIKQGWVQVDDEPARQRDKLMGGEEIEVMVPELREVAWQPQKMSLNTVYQDQALLVINKPPGLVVHPGAGNPDGTVLNGLLHAHPELASLPRAGIVHRLDKETSGLMVVARTEVARLGLIEQLADHSMFREYLALVYGRVISGGTVDEPIARDKHDRRKMTINMMGKTAVTHYRVEHRYRHHTLLRIQLETGRTHQIRVHMQHLGFPLVGDPVYGQRLAIAGDCHADLEAQLRRFHRQALHATTIQYVHPVTQQAQQWQCPAPIDMQALLEACETDAEGR